MLRPAYAVFSLNSFIAAMLALYIGFSFGLPRPYWAMLTVYITAQPLTGALRSKALYRVLGTVLGGAAAVAIVPPLVNAPVLLSLAMAGWAGLCLYLSLLDRTPRAYVFMLAGYTAAIIGFPSVVEPQAVFDTALSRVEEIVLGILCASVVHSVLLPRDVTGALNGRVAKFMGDARRWISEALMGQHGPAEERQRRRLAEDVTELQVLSTHLPFDTSSLRPRVRAVRALQDRLAVLLPLLSGVEDRLAALRQAGALQPDLEAATADAAAWAADPSPAPEVAAVLEARCRAIAARAAASPGAWASLLEASAATRLAELIDALQQSRDLAAYIADPRSRAPAAVAQTASRRPLHRDHGLAALSAFAQAMAVLGCCAFWFFTAWPEGAVAAMMAAVFASFYATQDDPAPALTGFLTWVALSVPISAVYLFAILPAIDGFPLLVVVLAPAFLVMGYLQADPKQNPKGMPLLIGTAGALSLQEVFTADFPGFLNSNLALLAGVGAALSSTLLFRSLSAGWSARRLLRRGWRDIARLAAAPRAPGREAWTGAALDRLGLLTPRLASADRDAELDAADAMTDLRVGLNVIELKAAALHAREGKAAEAALQGVSRLYARRAAGKHEDDRGLLSTLDAAIREVGRAPPHADRDQGLVALTGLRRTLFPAAAPFEAPFEVGA